MGIIEKEQTVVRKVDVVTCDNNCGQEVLSEEFQGSTWIKVSFASEVHVYHLCSFACLHAWSDRGKGKAKR